MGADGWEKQVSISQPEKTLPDLLGETLLMQQTTTQKIQVCFLQETTDMGPSPLGMDLPGQNAVGE